MEWIKTRVNEMLNSAILESGYENNIPSTVINECKCVRRSRYIVACKRIGHSTCIFTSDFSSAFRFSFHSLIYVRLSGSGRHCHWAQFYLSQKSRSIFTLLSLNYFNPNVQTRRCGDDGGPFFSNRKKAATTTTMVAPLHIGNSRPL